MSKWQFDEFSSSEYIGSFRINDGDTVSQNASTGSKALGIRANARIPLLSIQQRVALVVAAQRIADDAAAALENLAGQTLDDETILRAFDITLDPALDYDAEGEWIVINDADGSEVMGWKRQDGTAAGAVEAMCAIVTALDDPGVPFGFPCTLTCRPAKLEFPQTYRCRACGSDNVQAAVWTNLNDPDLDEGDDFFVDDIFQPSGRGIYCPDCGAEETGVYAPKTGPESGKYPADDEDDPDHNPVERFMCEKCGKDAWDGYFSASDANRTGVGVCLCADCAK
jgi:hypothetical protein